MKIRTGTCHFLSFNSACKYYEEYHEFEDVKECVQYKINNNEIVIGLPILKPGQSLEIIDGGTRYATVEEKS